MKQSIIMQRTNGYYGAFYRDYYDHYAICVDFIKLFTDSLKVTVSVTNKRPHQARWRKITSTEKGGVILGRGGPCFDLLICQREFMDKYGDVLWIKIDPAQ